MIDEGMKFGLTYIPSMKDKTAPEVNGYLPIHKH